MQRTLIALEPEDVVAALIDDLRGDLGLTAHRIDSHDAACKLQQLQKLGNGRDLVGCLLGGFLPQHQPIADAPGAVPVQRRRGVAWRRSRAPRAVLPSTATTSPSVTAATVRVQLQKHA